MPNTPYYIEVLRRELATRKEQNPRFSLRAFARRLRLHPSALSRVLSRKQPLSTGAAILVIEELKLEHDEKRRFLHSVADDRHRQETVALARELDMPNLRTMTTHLDAEAYAEVFNLEAHAILQLTFAEDFSSDADWIAERLGLTREKVVATLGALESLGFLSRTGGELKSTNRNMSAIRTERTDEVRREHQRQILRAALASLDACDFSRRSNYGVTMTIDPARLAGAQDIIVRFLEALNDHLESGSRREVYQLALQLFPLQR